MVAVPSQSPGINYFLENMITNEQPGSVGNRMLFLTLHSSLSNQNPEKYLKAEP